MNNADDLRQFMVQHTSRIAECTVPLLGDFTGGPDHFASCVLLKVGESHFLLTAAHVTDEFPKAPLSPSDASPGMLSPIYLPTTTTAHHPLLVRAGKILSTRTPPGGRRQDDHNDMGVVELEPDFAAVLGSFLRFLTLDDLELDPTRLRDGCFMFLGYPEDRVDKDDAYRIITASVLPFLTELHDHGKEPLEGFDPALHLALDVGEPRIIDGESCGYDLDQAGGISGGGIWRVMDPGQPIESLDWRAAKLVGIAHTADIGRGVLLGTKVKYALSMIVEGFPHLLPEIAGRFPLRFFTEA